MPTLHYYCDYFAIAILCFWIGGFSFIFGLLLLNSFRIASQTQKPTSITPIRLRIFGALFALSLIQFWFVGDLSQAKMMMMMSPWIISNKREKLLFHTKDWHTNKKETNNRTNKTHAHNWHRHEFTWFQPFCTSIASNCKKTPFSCSCFSLATIEVPKSLKRYKQYQINNNYTKKTLPSVFRQKKKK